MKRARQIPPAFAPFPQNPQRVCCRVAQRRGILMFTRPLQQVECRTVAVEGRRQLARLQLGDTTQPESARGQIEVPAVLRERADRLERLARGPDFTTLICDLSGL